MSAAAHSFELSGKALPPQSGGCAAALQRCATVVTLPSATYTDTLRFTSWQSFYDGDLQSVYALVVVPALFLGYRLMRGRPPHALRADAADFVDGYAIVFALETILDPLATGPLVRALGLAAGGGTAVLVLFVLLGDFRVYLLVFGLIAIAHGHRWSAGLPLAAAATVVVPLIAYTADAALHHAIAGVPDNSIWMVYEWLFVAVALGLRRIVPQQVGGDARAAAYLRGLLLYVALYYALWASSDVLIQLAGIDAGWLLRVLPNQLYYSGWVPVAYFAFFSRR